MAARMLSYSSKCIPRFTRDALVKHFVGQSGALAGWPTLATLQQRCCTTRWVNTGKCLYYPRKALPSSHTSPAAAASQPLNGVDVTNFDPKDITVILDVSTEGKPQIDRDELEHLSGQLEVDGELISQAAVHHLWLEQGDMSKPPRPVEWCLILCDDTEIASLNREWRGKDGPTDVLSFALLDDDEDDPDNQLIATDDKGYPNTVLGDVFISVDTAQRQAEERGHSLLIELRILAVHGVLHLLGYDHERGKAAAEEMALEEQRILSALGWDIKDGLINAVVDCDALHADVRVSSDATECGTATAYVEVAAGAANATADLRRTDSSEGTLDRVVDQLSRGRSQKKPDIRMVALDMDGTLLNSKSKVLPSSVSAIKAALRMGVTVMLATGKARPAAMAAMDAVRLAGPGLVVSQSGPGIFLQGLAVYGLEGQLLAGSSLSRELVKMAFEWSTTNSIPCCAFLGDECVTLRQGPELRELHGTYYEPLAQELGSVDEVLAGPDVKKMLLMTHPARIREVVKPHWEAAAPAVNAEVMQAVPDMLELVPQGINKWVGMQRLLDHMGLPSEALMVVGDGGNDLEMVANAGLGIAMKNAVPAVKNVADHVVASNDDDGVAEAFERFVL